VHILHSRVCKDLSKLSHFLQECDYLRGIALPRLQVSTVVDTKTGKVCTAPLYLLHYGAISVHVLVFITVWSCKVLFYYVIMFLLVIEVAHDGSRSE